MKEKKFAVYKNGKIIQTFNPVQGFLGQLFDYDKDGVPDIWRQAIINDPKLIIKRMDGPEPVTILSKEIIAAKKAGQPLPPEAGSLSTPTSAEPNPVHMDQSTTPLSPTEKQKIGNFFRIALLVAGLWILADIFLF